MKVYNKKSNANRAAINEGLEASEYTLDKVDGGFVIALRRGAVAEAAPVEQAIEQTIEQAPEAEVGAAEAVTRNPWRNRNRPRKRQSGDTERRYHPSRSCRLLRRTIPSPSGLSRRADHGGTSDRGYLVERRHRPAENARREAA
jgi:hypothetical protein